MNLVFSKTENKNLIQSVQMYSISGTIKICKTFLRFAVWHLSKVYSECYIRSSVGWMDIFVVFRIEKLFWWWFHAFLFYLLIYLSCLTGINFDIVANMYVSLFCCEFRMRFYVDHMNVYTECLKRIISDNFHW